MTQKTDKQILFERMHKVAGMPLNEDEDHWDEYNEFDRAHQPDVQDIDEKLKFFNDNNQYFKSTTAKDDRHPNNYSGDIIFTPENDTKIRIAWIFNKNDGIVKLYAVDHMDDWEFGRNIHELIGFPLKEWSLENEDEIIDVAKKIEKFMWDAHRNKQFRPIHGGYTIATTGDIESDYSTRQAVDNAPMYEELNENEIQKYGLSVSDTGEGANRYVQPEEFDKLMKLLQLMVNIKPDFDIKGTDEWGFDDNFRNAFYTVLGGLGRLQQNKFNPEPEN